MYDCVIVGGGVVGLATAYAFSSFRPSARVAVVEKEGRWAAHQSGRNSGVIHSGIYYKPGSLKAELCKSGSRTLLEFCRDNDVPAQRCGKLIVATRIDELAGLEALHDRGRAHGLAVRRLSAGEAREIEPHVAALAALHVEETGVVDFGRVAQALAKRLAERGVELRTGSAVTAIVATASRLVVQTATESLLSRTAVNCAGLQADRLAIASGLRPAVRIVPFRGEYMSVRAERRDLVRHLIYPVPDPSFPFLGVHLTRSIDGSVHAGPNAVLALAREGYRWRDVSARDLRDIIRFPGFWRLARGNLRAGADEVLRSFSKRLFLHGLQRLVPDLTAEDLLPSGAGVRAQALRRDGSLVDDFMIESQGSALHVLNAPSPAATSSFAIGEHIARRVDTLLT
jgi:(S)-2-hydroxyglutarate dehydrogenase